MEKENKIDKFYQNFIYRQGNMWYGGNRILQGETHDVSQGKIVEKQ